MSWHRRSVAACVAAFESIPEERWGESRAPGQWTVAQIAEHLALGYESALAVLAGGAGMRMVLPWWKTRILRLTVLRRILAGRGFPHGAPAPREIRPGKSPPGREPALARLRAVAAETERAFETTRPAVQFTHAYFGRLRPEQLLRLQAAHLDHHRQQLEALGQRPPEAGLRTAGAATS